MIDLAPVVRMFQARLREELPELALSSGLPASDGSGNFTLLDIPCPSGPCRLGVLCRGDCFEISFSVPGTRGPAEQQVIIAGDMDGSVTDTIDFIRGIMEGRILVDVLRYRLPWFQPYYLAFFRESSRRPERRRVRTLSWNMKDEHPSP